MWQARIAILLVGATGIYIIQEADLWGRFSVLTYWWMHAIVGVWAIFAIGLFWVEPFFLDRRLHRWAANRPASTLAWLAGVAVLVRLNTCKHWGE